MTTPDTDTLAGLLADATPGPWEAALETGCHGVVASVPPTGETKMVAIIGNSLESPELEPMRFANARLIALAPELAAEVIALRAQAAKDKARIERLEAALREIAGIKEREKNCYPPDWREQIAACPECQRYKDHPIQRGICDDHRKPIYAQEDHNRHETKILGYRAMDIARAALEDGE